MVNSISAQEYYAMNQDYLSKKEELEAKIRQELTQNADNYPENAAALYYGSKAEMSEEDALKLAHINELLEEIIKKDKKELEDLLADIVKYAGHVAKSSESVKE